MAAGKLDGQAKRDELADLAGLGFKSVGWVAWPGWIALHWTRVGGTKAKYDSILPTRGPTPTLPSVQLSKCLSEPRRQKQY